MIPLEEIDSRLSNIKKDRAWLVENTPYSADYIRTVLAPNSKRRTARVMKVLLGAIEAEEKDQSSPVISSLPSDRITIEVESDRMTSYCEAADTARQDLKTWAITELNRAAAKWAEEKKRLRLHSEGDQDSSDSNKP